MSEVLVVFDAQLTSPDGRRWTAQSCGGIADDGLWEGWLEFLPVAGGDSPVRTPRETEQPNRDLLMYWAQGLTAVYLDGALGRALESQGTTRRKKVEAQPAFASPARTAQARSSLTMPHAILNPFDVYQEGADVLVAQLGALDTARLRDMAVAYGFAAPSESMDAGRERLTALIVAGARSGLNPLESEMRRQR